MLIFLDESGDLGWTLDKRYRQGGSSQHLTLASLCVSREAKDLPKRVVRKLYKRYRWPTGNERKWGVMVAEERKRFAELARDLAISDTRITYLSITVRKTNVQEHIRQEPNILYNYMLGLSLLEKMASEEEVGFYPDARSIKLASGNSLHDYLQTQLWFEIGAKTQLHTHPTNSTSNLNLQFADMLCGAVQAHFEDGDSTYLDILRPAISPETLYF